MEPPWTAAEGELLPSSIHSNNCGRLCLVVRNWIEIADLMNTEAARRGLT